MNSNEIYSLVQHIELNKKGWVVNGIKAIIKQVLGERSDVLLSKKEIEDILKNINEFRFNSLDFEKAINDLKSNKELIELPKNCYQLSSEEKNNFESSLKKYRLVESETKKFFINTVSKLVSTDTGIDYEDIWNDFVSLLIIPLIAKTGAKSFEIITGNGRDIDYTNDNEFFHKYQHISSNLQRLIISFFSVENEFVKNYLLNLLKAYYFVEASHLPKESLEKIYDLSKVQSSLKIFVDTNFLLSLLDLHDNPSNDAANSLRDLLSEVQNKIDVKFYVFPITISEFKNLISKYKDYLKRKPLLLSHAKTLIDRDEISGVPKKYYQKCIEIGSKISLDDYFDPYLNNLTVTLRKNGLELQNENLDRYSQVKNMTVNDDIIAQVEHRIEKSKSENGTLSEAELEEKKENIEKKFKHDCILWHAVFNKRPEYIDSVKDIKNWILTLDFQFLSYDRYKTSILNKEISLCLHPNDLISLLYFWVPRTQSFEKAVLENFKLPFTFKEFDQKAEEISISILSALSYYENSDELDKQTVAEILTNQVLRSKIDSDASIEENAKIIKDEIFDKYIEKKKEIDKKEGENTELRDQIKNVEAKIVELSEKIVQLIENQIESKRKGAINELKIRKEYLTKQIKEQESELDEIKDLRKKAVEEANIESKKIINIFKSKKTIKEKVFNRYPKINAIRSYELELEKTKQNLSDISFEVSENTIFFCENKNAGYFNQLSFKKITFLPETNSASVFIKTTSNPTYFGLRDRDFLTDSEVYKLKNKFPNYKILNYYCFENYLYHPENLESLELPNFDKVAYINEIVRQVSSNRDEILMNLKNTRKSYQEFRTSENGINPEKNASNNIISSLDSNDIEEILKFFSLKNLNKSFLNTYNLKTNRLIKTEWFINQIKTIMEI